MDGERRRTRWRIVVPLTVVVAVVVGAGGALALRHITMAPASEQTAQALARRLLASCTGRSWKPARRAPDPTLDQPPQSPALAGLVATTGYWTSAATPAAVQAWMRIHPPTGTRVEVTGTEGTTGAFTGFRPTTLPAGVAYEMLLVSTRPLLTGGTGIRVDAQVVVVPARPTWEHVPTDERTVTITVTWDGNHRPLTGTSHDPEIVERLAAGANRLSRNVVLKTTCPITVEVTWQARFTGNGAPVTVRSDDCGFTQFSRGTRKGPVLVTDHTMLEAEARLLGRTVEEVDDLANGASTTTTR